MKLGSGLARFNDMRKAGIAVGLGTDSCSSLQPDFLAQPFLARQQLVEILHDYAPPALGIYAVLPSNRYIPHRVGVLMDHLAVVLGRQSG
jgi:hypothetical protein